MKEFIKRFFSVGKIVIPFVSLTGIIGSFSLSASGEIPCPYCLIARYSIMVIFLLSVIGLFLKKNPIYIVIAIISLPPIIASATLVVNDYFLQGGTEICYSENSQVHCTSPMVFGIHVSLYTLLISLALLFFSTSVLIADFIKRYEDNNPCRK